MHAEYLIFGQDIRNLIPVSTASILVLVANNYLIIMSNNERNENICTLLETSHKKLTLNKNIKMLVCLQNNTIKTNCLN